jgi:hypothetical protein
MLFLFSARRLLVFRRNIPAKPREMLSFSGGLPAYMEKCRESAERGYEGFAIS